MGYIFKKKKKYRWSIINTKYDTSVVRDEK